jgi:cyclopropane-fatty-acyl-phospholipid synthase
MDRHSSTADSASPSADSSAGLNALLRPLEDRLLDRLSARLSRVPVRLVLWDGRQVSSADGAPVATVTIRDRRTFLQLLWNPDLYFGEGFMTHRLEVQGDLVALLEGIARGRPYTKDRSWRPPTITASDSRDNVHHHYDLGNDFYRLWLDEGMLYTCAYFEGPDVSLEQAQVAKLDHVCRKLRLLPGERVVEAGCGWGALALHMAKRYGVTVRAFNLSHEQIAYARQRAQEEGLADRVEFIEDDYRTIHEGCDAFVSVGMLEHVGVNQYEALGAVIDRTLPTDRGRALLHFIGRNRPAPLNPWIVKRIFPGGYPPTIAEVSERILQPFDFSLLDVENLRLHYARTLEHWLRRFEDHAQEVRQMFDESFTRAWRLYLAGSQAAFRAGSMQLFQIVFARGRDNNVPWTRRGLYEDQARGERREARA